MRIGRCVNDKPDHHPAILVIEDDPDGLRSVADALELSGYEVLPCGTGKEGILLFEEHDVDAVLSDIRLPDLDGVEVMSRIRRMDPSVPVILMTAYGTVAAAVEALKAGAYDYILKPLDLDDIRAKTKRAVETRMLRSRITDLKRELRQEYPERIIAKSAKMLHVLRQAKSVAPTLANVLVTGESGTGKELLARFIHMESERSDGPFVAVNCGAFAESLLESELFGHEQGAFTGALKLHRGAFERASGGTLFLDEIGIAPAPVQTRLLRVLEQREITRVGGNSTIPVDARIISATNRQLNDLAADKEFRRDLLFRLRVVTISIPSLRERRSDIRPMINHFLAVACSNHGRRIESVAPDYYEALERHDWPGNARELRNAVESSVIMATSTHLCARDLDLDNELKQAVVPKSATQPLALADIEKQAILESLSRHKGSRTIAARELGVSTRTIQRKIKEHGLPF